MFLNINSLGFIVCTQAACVPESQTLPKQIHKQKMLGKLSDIDVSLISFSIHMIFLTEK